MSDFFRMMAQKAGGGESVPETTGNEDPSLALAIDDSLPVLDRISTYINSDILLQRIYIIRSLRFFAPQLGFKETDKHIIPLLESLMTEQEPSIRQALTESIPEVARYLVETKDEEAYKIALHILVPLTVELCTDRTPRVRSSATSSLIMLASMSRQEDVEVFYCPIIKSLAKDTTSEDHRIAAAQLVTSYPTFMTQSSALTAVQPMILSLAADPSHKVRKVVAANLEPICKLLEQSLSIEHVVPMYIALCADSVWGVRKAAVESLIGIGNVFDFSKRAAILLPIFERLLDDQSRWVKGSCYHILGQFIALLKEDQVSSKLIQHFNLMLSVGKTIGDSDMNLKCAFHFPAVLYTIGANKWPEISGLYQQLVKDPMWKVRQTMAYSLHEIAKILGTEASETILIPVFEGYLRDIDEIKLAVMKHMGEFLVNVTTRSQRKYLTAFAQLQHSKNWRIRKELVKQLEKLCVIYNPADNHEHILPLLLIACHDSFACIRKAAGKRVGPMLRRLLKDQIPGFLEVLILQLLNLATHSSYSTRQLFSQILAIEKEFFAANLELFHSRFLPKFTKLSKDKVANVRMSFAQMLAELRTLEAFAQDEKITELLTILAEDKDRDVRSHARLALGAKVVASPKLENLSMDRLQDVPVLPLVLEPEEEKSLELPVEEAKPPNEEQFSLENSFEKIEILSSDEEVDPKDLEAKMVDDEEVKHHALDLAHLKEVPTEPLLSPALALEEPVKDEKTLMEKEEEKEEKELDKELEEEEKSEIKQELEIVKDSTEDEKETVHDEKEEEEIEEAVEEAKEVEENETETNEEAVEKKEEKLEANEEKVENNEEIVEKKEEDKEEDSTEETTEALETIT